MARLAKASISRIIIERTLKLVTVTVNTARPGIIIGKGGQEVDKLKEELKKFFHPRCCMKGIGGNSATLNKPRPAPKAENLINLRV